MKDLAVMIPVKDNSEYLKIALDSLKVQTSTNFEVVLIDDGSTEDLKPVLEGYDFKINYIRNDECKGVGQARDIGLKYILENDYKYIMFLDSDDRFKPNTVEVAVREISEKELDWVQFYSELSTQDTLMCHIPSHTLWNGIYRLSTIKELNLSFAGLQSHEDLYFMELLRIHGVSHLLIDDVLYEHKLNHNSIVHTSKLLEYNYIKCVKAVCDFIESSNGVFTMEAEAAGEMSELILFCYPCHQACKLQNTEDKDLIECVKNILTFADKYSILKYTLFNVPSQAYVGEHRSFYEKPTGLYVFRQSLDKWLQKYGNAFQDIKVYR